MINSRTALQEYLHQDLAAHGLTSWKWSDRFKYPVLAWQRHLRKVEYIKNRSNSKVSKLYALLRLYLFRRHSIRMGFTIPPNVFGPGLVIVHWGTIVVNDHARVGANCRIHPSSSIGRRADGAPKIGDNCYIAPGARIFGPITIGDNVKIGANAVVNKSFGNDIVLVGIPAKASAAKA